MCLSTHSLEIFGTRKVPSPALVTVFSQPFPEESVAVSPGHHCFCGKYFKNIPCTKVLQGVATHMKRLWKSRGRLGPTPCLQNPRQYFAPQSSLPVGSDISSVFELSPRAAQPPWLKVPILSWEQPAEKSKILESLLWAAGKRLRAMRLNTQWMWEGMAADVTQHLARQL